VREHRLSALSGVWSTSGAENGAVHIVRDFAADRVGYVVPHNPKVTASTTRRDVLVPWPPSTPVTCGSVRDRILERYARRRCQCEHRAGNAKVPECGLSRDRPERIVVRDGFERHARCFKHWTLREHRLQVCHRVRMFHRVPYAHVGDLTLSSIDPDEVMDESGIASRAARNADSLSARSGSTSSRRASGNVPLDIRTII
jgi:hypothetical protein